MTRRGSQPLRRAAPLRLAASPGWLALVVASIALLTASLVAPALFSRAAAGAALDTGISAVEDDAFTSTTPDVRATWSGVLLPYADELVRDALTRLPYYSRPVISAAGTANRRGERAIVRFGGKRGTMEPSELYFRGGAVEALGGTADGDGVWLDEDIAAALGATVGDPLEIGIERAIDPGAPRTAPTFLAGTYHRLPGSALPEQLAGDRDIARRDLPWNPDNPGVGFPLVIANQATFERLARGVSEAPLWTADLRLDPDITPATAQTAARAFQVLADQAFDDRDPVASALSAAKPAPTRLQLSSGLPDIVAAARETAKATQAQAAPFANAGIALAVIVVCAATVLLGRSRRRELDLLSGLGVRPRQVAALTALELLLPALVGAALGAAVAWQVVGAVGPPGPLTDGESGAAARAGLAALVAIALGAGCAGVVAWATDRRAASSRLGAARRPVPWEAVLLAATVFSAVAVVTTDVGDRPSSPLAVVFPLLLAGSASLVVLRVLGRLDLRRWSRATPGSARWLAGQRARTAATETAAVTLALAVGLSVLGYALAVHRGVTQGSEDKVAALSGARTRVDIGNAFARKKKSIKARNPVRSSTLVYRQTTALPPLFGGQPLFVIDSRTFAGVVDWGATGTLDRGRTLLPLLRTGGTKKPVPVLLAGDTDKKVGEHGTLDILSEWSAPYVVVGIVPAFPGSESDTGDVAVVADARRLMQYVPKRLDPRVIQPPNAPPGGLFTTWLWSSASSAAVSHDLTAAKITPVRGDSRASAASRSELLAAGWSSGYVVALGCCALLLVAAAALVLAVRLADRDAVSDVLLRRMSWSPTDLAAARTWEVASVITGALVAAAVAILAMAAAPSTVEPAVGIPPLTHPIPGLADAGLLVGAGAVLVVLCGAIARRRAGARVAAEVLRGNG